MADLYTRSRKDYVDKVDQSKRICYLSYIRAIACIAIIVLHMFASASILFGEQIGVRVNAYSRAISNIMMWAVPCFVMTTGALLLDADRKITYKKLFGKYILRIFSALLLCCIGFRIFDMVMDGETPEIGILLDALYEMFTGTGWSHLWYLYLLLGLYLLMPVYKKIAEYSTKVDMRYLLVVYVLFISVLPLLYIWNLNSGFYKHVSTIYPFYLFCGYALTRNVFRVHKWIAALAAVLSTCVILVLTVIRWTENVEVMEQLWSYSSILVIVQAVSIFSLFSGIKGQGESLAGKLLLKIDRCSFGIYLIHMVFVRLILRYMNFNPYTGSVCLNFFLLILGVFLVSYMCTWILKKIPVLKQIL